MPSYAVPKPGERCHVLLLDLYFSAVPSETLQKDHFYLRPLQKKPEDHNTSCFASRHQHYQMLSKMCEKAELKHHANYSLHATGASDIFQANVPEHVLQSRMGHLSLKALRTYERVTEEHQKRPVRC